MKLKVAKNIAGVINVFNICAFNSQTSIKENWEKWIVFFIGKLVKKFFNSIQIAGGSLRHLTKGKIQLRSEGSAIFFKVVKIRTN